LPIGQRCAHNDEVSQVRYVDPSEVLVVPGAGLISMRITLGSERSILNAQVKRAFPLSHPDKFISIQDGEGKEVAVLRTMDGLDPESLAQFQSALDRRYFTPKIVRIIFLRLEAGMWRFSVVTQRGDAEFYVRNWRDSAFELTPGRWQIQTVDGARFEIENLDALDDASRRLMDQLL
jgi:hypothetical protein